MLQVRRSKGESLRRVEKLCFDFLTNVIPNLFDTNDKLRITSTIDIEKDNAVLKQETDFLKLRIDELDKKVLESKKREKELMEILDDQITNNNTSRKRSLSKNLKVK